MTSSAPPRSSTDAALATRLFPVGQHALTSDDYYTPAWVFDRMSITFDLDVCAPPGGIPWIPATRFFDMADDGLAQPWEGRVWMNPPYSDVSPWVRRFIVHRHGVCLVPHAKSAWHLELWNAADGIVFAGGFPFEANHIDLTGRSPGTRYGWPFMSVFFAAFGEECVEAIARLGRVRR